MPSRPKNAAHLVEVLRCSKYFRSGGWAESGRTGCRQNSSTRRQASLVPFKASAKRHLNVAQEARTSEMLCKPTCRAQNLDIPRAGRVRAHGGAVGRGRAGPHADRTVSQETRFPRPFKASKTRRLHDPPASRTYEILYVNRWRNTKTGRRAAHVRFMHGLSPNENALGSLLITSGTTCFCLCQFVLCLACPDMQDHKERLTRG